MFCHSVDPQCTIISKGSRWAARGTTGKCQENQENQR